MTPPRVMLAAARQRVRDRRTPPPWMVRVSAMPDPESPGVRLWKVSVHRSGQAEDPVRVKNVSYTRPEAEEVAAHARERVVDPRCDPRQDVDLFTPRHGYGGVKASGLPSPSTPRSSD